MAAITVNGEERQFERLGTVAELVAELGLESSQVAVERNREIVPRASHSDTQLEAGDVLEIVTLVGGG